MRVSPSSTWASISARCSRRLLCPFLADAVGWWAGFGLAALGMLFSWTLIQFDGGRLGGYGEPPSRACPNRSVIIFICALAARAGRSISSSPT